MINILTKMKKQRKHSFVIYGTKTSQNFTSNHFPNTRENTRIFKEPHLVIVILIYSKQFVKILSKVDHRDTSRVEEDYGMLTIKDTGKTLLYCPILSIVDFAKKIFLEWLLFRPLKTNNAL